MGVTELHLTDGHNNYCHLGNICIPRYPFWCMLSEQYFYYLYSHSHLVISMFSPTDINSDQECMFLILIRSEYWEFCMLESHDIMMMLTCSI